MRVDLDLAHHLKQALGYLLSVRGKDHAVVGRTERGSRPKPVSTMRPTDTAA
jgi:hypothetical protein